jgi:capsular polysaccharide biosynthesis protein
MSQETLDLRRSLQIVRRHRIAVGAAVVVGLFAGIAYGQLRPPMPASTALVVLSPSTRDVSTQVVIADSEPVLRSALTSIPAMSLPTLQSDIQVRNPNPYIISITARGKTDSQAEDLANAVAASYIAYVSKGGEVQAQAKLLVPATTAARRSLITYLLLTGGAGGLAGLLLGVIGALALSRGDRRLRKRDEIAHAVGVPVLASIPVRHPASPSRWASLLDDYRPAVAHAWQLRNALRYLGQANPAAADATNGDGPSVRDSLSVTVLALSSDPGALALGPQLAVFAASLGIPTALVVDLQQDANVTAALRAACAAPPSPGRPALLKVAVADPEDASWRELRAALAIVVSVVDGRAPRVADTMRTSAMVLGISSGAATAAQLAGVALSAADDDRQIDGILVADPEATDGTTGRIPQLGRPPRYTAPTRLTGAPTETTREAR